MTAQAMARSPQSAPCTRSSSNKGGSVNGPTLVSSPPLEQRSEETCDLLDEAPGQMMRLRRFGDLGLCDRRILGPLMKQSPAMSTACKSANAGYYDLGPVLTHRQLQAAHVSLSLFFRWSSHVIFAPMISDLCCCPPVSSPEAAASSEATTVGGVGKAVQSQR